MHAPKHLLVPIDNSLYSLSALQYAEEIAKIFNAEITVLHVIDRGERVGSALEDKSRQETEQTVQKRMRGMIANLLVEYHLVPQSLRIEVRFGTPEKAIVRTAAEMRVDLIVMSTHGRTGLRHVLMGSVAEAVVRKALCPVLTVKPEEFRELIDITEKDVENSLHIGGEPKEN